MASRAYRCRRFRGEPAYGKDTLVRRTFYGFRFHARVCWPDVISRFVLAPANAHELAAVPALTAIVLCSPVGAYSYLTNLTNARIGGRNA